MLGLEAGDDIKVSGYSYSIYTACSNGFYAMNGKGASFIDINLLNDLIEGKVDFEKLPQKPKLTEAERVILENLPKEYKWIVRTDSFNVLLIYTNKPERFTHYWFKSCGDISTLEPFKHLFQFIKVGR